MPCPSFQSGFLVNRGGRDCLTATYRVSSFAGNSTGVSYAPSSMELNHPRLPAIVSEAEVHTFSMDETPEPTPTHPQFYSVLEPKDPKYNTHQNPKEFIGVFKPTDDFTPETSRYKHGGDPANEEINTLFGIGYDKFLIVGVALAFLYFATRRTT